MSGTGKEKEVEICATNITDKTRCKSIIAICGVRPEHSRLKFMDKCGESVTFL
jgi:hypothetical protein